MISIIQLKEINNLMRERHKLANIINLFNNGLIGLNIIETKNKEVAYDEDYINKYLLSELTHANEIVLNKLKQELENIENKLSQHIDLT